MTQTEHSADVRTENRSETVDSGELVTVVIPAYNEEPYIGPCVESILEQTYRPMEVIVVDGGSQDATADVVRRIRRSNPSVKLLVNEQRLIPISLNRAMGEAGGRWLVRVDAHAKIPVDYVANAVRLLKSGDWGGVGGRKDCSGVSRWGDAIAAAMSSPFGVGNSYYHYGTEPREVDHVPFGAYPLDVVRELGGWDPNLAVNQDFEFDHRVRQSGRRILFDPSLRVEWQSRQTLADLFRQYRRYGRGKFTVMRKHPLSTKPRQLAGPALVVALVAATVALVVGWWIPAATLAVAYGSFLLAGAAQQTMKSGASLWRTAAAFAAMHIGHGLGFFNGLFRAAIGRS